MSILLSIDLGTSSVRTMAMQEDGTVLGVCQRHYGVEVPRAGWAEQQPQMWYEKAVETIRGVRKQPEVAGEEIAALGFSGQMHGLVCVDEKEEPLCPALIWQDQRAAEVLGEMYRRLGEDFITSQVQNRVSAGFLLGSLYWMKEKRPEIYERIYQVMLPKDYLKLRLCGELLTDYSDAAGSAAFDNVRMSWAKPLIEGLGLDPEKFPPIQPSSAVVGTLTAQAARDTGLPMTVKVVNGGADQCMQTIGNGIIRDGILASNIGTGGQICTTISRPLYDRKLRTNTFAHAVDGHWNFMGAALSSGSSMKWYMEQILEGEDYGRMNREAEQIPAGSEGLLFLPYLVGERTPHQDPLARGMFCGLTLKHGRFHLARAVMEGVTFSLRDCMEVLLEYEVPCDKIIAAGGGAASPVWLQIQADILGRPIYKSLTGEQACMGAAITAGVGIGVYGSYQEACDTLVRLDDRVYEPIESNRRYYEELYGLYRELYEKNKNMFAALSDQRHTKG